ncbi:hypothetical protein HDF26_001180 [Pedobacter cryoconitis]|uniref:hypothetical protein n=1 Tax=Pedobacter cryoconitis TaxID=188932 RepID=UPI00161B9A16|nr:hypothetical protein [Pedobacter cryoconitis]MBB6270753.1 hypothetical protein [Pedobacter cryoconitis]
MFITKKKIQKEFQSINGVLHSLKENNTAQLFLQANILSRLNQNNTIHILKNIHLAEFKVYSQWKDDGIIQFLVDYLDIESKTFIEFGVSDYAEANTRYLLMNNNWTGLIMDGSEDNMKSVQREEIYWRYHLTALKAFITTDNINGLIEQNGFKDELGLLHIDIDGNDYWVWKAITVVNPVIVIVEYNSIFGKDKAWTIPYKADFDRNEAHYSNLYFGTSLCSIYDLAKEKGYSFIGCNSNGNNAYFVRNDKIKDLETKDINEGYVLSKFREGRDKNDKLTYLNGDDRLKEIKGMEVFNTRTNKIETI